MKVINLSKKQFNNLKKMDIADYISNTEGDIYYFNYKFKKKVLKILYTLEGEDFANKLYTLEMLDYYKKYIPNNLIVPDYLVAVNNNVEGFTEPLVEGVNLKTVLRDKRLNVDEQKYYLCKVGEILEQLKNIRKYTDLKKFFISDLHSGNFVVNNNNKELYVVDLDSSRIADNNVKRFLFNESLMNSVDGKYDVIPAKYGYGFVIANEESEIYWYVIMVLEYLYGANIDTMSLEDYYEYLNYLSLLGINSELLDIFYSIVNNSSNINPQYLINNLTESQIFRANSMVYKKIR